MEFIDPRTTPYQPPAFRGQLPHLYKPGGCYFVTCRLADAIIPSSSKAAAYPSRPTKYDPESIATPHEPRITLGSCALRDARIASLVQDALRFFNGERYILAAWCIMPNHVHAILSPLPPHSLSQILKSWKGFTARRANQLLERTGPFWGAESFDHLIRSPEHYDQFKTYVENNPVKAGLSERPQDWPYCSAGFQPATLSPEKSDAG